jgi:endonuclease/exonuclease/phosphatase family metal-dependent hydrolase
VGLTLTGSKATRLEVASLLAALVASSLLAAEPPLNQGLRIATYNVENYLLMPRRLNGKLHTNAGKPEPEKEAVAKVIASVQPDVLGLMEIGDPAQLEDLRRHLHQQGVEYPHIEFLQAADTTRHLVLLSRFPIVERHSLGEIPLRVNGMTLHSPRGIIDVTVEPPKGERVRILCVHLKAKLEVAEYDEADLRNAEAEFLRRHVREILRTDPSTRLVLMGDFNETKNSQTIREVTGKPEWSDSLTALPLTDERGELWTEYWSAADTYSRIDYIMVSKRLVAEVDAGRSGIARPSSWSKASDHCLLFITIGTSSTNSLTKTISSP